MARTGTWADQRRYNPVAHQVRGVDPVHQDTQGPPGYSDHEAPPGEDYGLIGEMPWVEDWIFDAPGARLDDFPESHDVVLDHAADYGEARNAVSTIMETAPADEVYVKPSWDGMTPQLPPYGEVRGRNARPEMNPDGFRLGVHIGREWADRARWVSMRTRDRRIALLPGPALPNTSLDTVPDDPGRYSSPFSAWARGVNGSGARPAQRRLPGSMDESVMVEAADDEMLDAGADPEWL